MNPRQVSRISLSPDVTDCIVFWTKNPTPLLGKLAEIRNMGHEFYFQFTLTPYDGEWEPCLPAKDVLLRVFQELSHEIGSLRMVWRYDPIIVDALYSPQWHIDRFSEYARILAGCTDTCIISFVDLYAKTLRNSHGKISAETSLSDMRTIASAFSQIGKEYGIRVKACSEQTDFSALGVARSACIDPTRIEKLLHCRLNVGTDKNQRSLCGCMESIDIGTYDSCMNGCIYCYANSSPARVKQNFALHDPDSPLLIGHPSAEDRIYFRKTESQKESQISLFE